MPDAVALRGRRLLVVEDEYVIAADLTASLEALGVEVAGPAASVAEALTLLENDGGRLDGACSTSTSGTSVCIRLPTCLEAVEIPFVFTTGYDAAVVPDF